MPAGKEVIERRAKILAIFASAPDRTFTVRDVYQRVMREASERTVKSIIERLRANKRIVTVKKMPHASTYRFAREIKTA